MSCTIIAPVHPNPLLHNTIINALQTAMETTGIFDEVYPLAEVMEIDMNGRRGIAPAIFGQDATKVNDYIQMFPDQSKRGICFFEIIPGNYAVNRGTEDGDLIDIQIRVVCTNNLKNLASRTYDFTDELMAVCYQALESSTLNQDINSISIVKDKNLIFSKYTYLFNELQSLAFPLTGYAFDLGITAEYNFECVTPGTFNESFSPEC